MRLFAQDLTTDTLQHIAARGLSEAGGPKPLLLRVLVDLFVRRPSHSDDEIQHFAEIAHSILPCATRAEIDHAAERLCTHPAAPGEVMDLLAVRAGAGALLLFEKCRRLSTGVLHQAALSGTVDAACAIAKRDDLDPATLDLLAARSERAIHLALVKNEYAPLSASFVQQMIMRASDDAELARALCHRLPQSHKIWPLFYHATRADRLLIIASANKQCADTKNTDLACHLSCDLSELIDHAQKGTEAFVAYLTQHLPCSDDWARRILHDQGGEPLIIILRALGAEPELITQIFDLIQPDLTQGQIIWRQALSRFITQSVAQNLLQNLLCSSGAKTKISIAEQKSQMLSA